MEKKINRCDTCLFALLLCEAIRRGTAQMDEKNNVIECNYYQPKEDKL